jgi:hypothetical protein
MGAIKKADVKIGATYRVRLNGAFRDVRIERVVQFRGKDAWEATNLQTGRTTVIKSAAKLRREIGMPVESHSEFLRGQEEFQAKPLPNPCLLSEMERFARSCPMCGMHAVLPLTQEQLAAQPDDTTHVCHPSLNGCNHGFARGVFRKD